MTKNMVDPARVTLEEFRQLSPLVQSELIAQQQAGIPLQGLVYGEVRKVREGRKEKVA